MVKALQQDVLASAPPQSQSVQVVRMQENPVMMGSNLSYEVVISYAALGETFHRSVIFVSTPDTWVVFCITAPKSEFDPLYASFCRSISSWEWIQATPSSAATVTPNPAPAGDQ